MLRSEVKVGQKVIFGRGRGEKTLGIVVRLNPLKAKVRTLEARGSRSPAGAEWGVPYSMLRLAPDNAQSADTVPVPVEKLTYNPFSDENTLLEALLETYSGLSPENLTGDGELPQSRVRQQYALLQRRLRGLTVALGRTIDEGAIYEWEQSRREYERNRQKTA